jgi:hypothetical protein
VKILSAKGSNIVPIWEVDPVFLAMYPSKKSVKAPIIKIIQDIKVR